MAAMKHLLHHWIRRWKLPPLAGSIALVFALTATADEPPLFELRAVLDGASGIDFTLPGGEQLLLAPQALLDASSIDVASLVESDFGAPAIAVRMTAEGTDRLAALSHEYLGRRLAILLRGRLVMAPLVHSPITGGELHISGSFAPGEAEAVVDAINQALATGSR